MGDFETLDLETSTFRLVLLADLACVCNVYLAICLTLKRPPQRWSVSSTAGIAHPPTWVGSTRHLDPFSRNQERYQSEECSKSVAEIWRISWLDFLSFSFVPGLSESVRELQIQITSDLWRLGGSSCKMFGIRSWDRTNSLHICTTKLKTTRTHFAFRNRRKYTFFRFRIQKELSEMHFGFRISEGTTQECGALRDEEITPKCGALRD